MLQYQQGLGNHFESEAIADALPRDQNCPQKAPFGLYTEQLSGSAFTVPQKNQLKTWLYRLRPSVVHEPFVRAESSFVSSFGVANDHDPTSQCVSTPNQLRWSPFPIPTTPLSVDFVQGLSTVCGAGDPSARDGMAIYVYACNADMTNKAMYNSDGEFLVVPQAGKLMVDTEMGKLEVAPGEIFVALPDKEARGYVCEIFDGHFELPDLGPIGANGLANRRHFMYPVAAYADNTEKYEICTKFQGHLYTTAQNHSPFDVVAWDGNYAPYKYDLSKFNTINSVSFDHPDPSIFTVLTAKSATVGVALCDFVIFPPRWMVAEKTFRPPYYHRNCMSEFMGLISGAYDAKKEGFLPGGASLHSIMTAHGPDRQVFEAATKAILQPEKLAANGLAFMFETNKMLSVSRWAIDKESPGGQVLQNDYFKCWQGLQKYFDSKNIDPPIPQ